MTSPVTRRVVLSGLGAGIGVSVLTPGGAFAEDFTRPRRSFAPASTVLRDGTPQSVGLLPAPIEEAKQAIRSHLVGSATSAHPLYAGAVGLMGHEGRIVAVDVSGMARRYADATRELPAAQQIPMRRDTIFDLASVSKLFTSLLAAQLIEEGKLDLEGSVAAYLPGFAVNGKSGVTIRQLLTHTSGFPSWLPLWSAYPDKDARLKAVLAAGLTHEPGGTYLYSDLNLITLALIIEKLRDAPLDVVVRERITQPLGMKDTGYNPTQRERTAATEFQAAPARGMVWGEVHDENAWSLGGVAGHAGVFSTADDLAILCQCLLNGGTYGRARILKPQTVTMLITDYNIDFPGDSHGLGFELDQRWYMDVLSGERTAGHTGFTGTSMVIDFASRSFALLLTNRVHPSRAWGSINPARREWARGLGMAMSVRPRHGDTAWFADTSDATASTLTTPQLELPDKAWVSFDLFVDSEETDVFRLEISRDAGVTWRPLLLTLRDRGELVTADGEVSGSGNRHWWQARATPEAGSARVRWSYVTDATTRGRGVAVDDLRIGGRKGTVFDAEKTPNVLIANGWRLVGREVVR